MSARINIARPNQQYNPDPNSFTPRPAYRPPSTNPDDPIEKLRQYGSKIEDIVDIYSQPLRPHLPAIGRFLIVITFLEDSLRILTQWNDQLWYLQKYFFVPLFENTMLGGSCLTITKRHSEYAVAGLLAVVLIQGFGYGLIFDMNFFLRNLSVIGGLLMVFSDSMSTRKKSFAGLPMLTGRVLLIFLFLGFMLQGKWSFSRVLVSLVGLAACGMVAVGFKAKWSAAFLVLILSAFNVFVNNWWSVHSAHPQRDFLKYDFFQTLCEFHLLSKWGNHAKCMFNLPAIVGGLLLLVNMGPGGLKWETVDHDALDSSVWTNPQGDVDNDPLGLRRSFVEDIDKLDLESKASVLVSSKYFDPKAFLSHAYPNATHQDLTVGVSNLRNSIDSRAEAIKVLVEENIDRFVAVKASSDAVYTEMKEGLLADETEYASKALREQLKQASMKADQVFLPVLENASKANKVRSTLGVFERSKFFFNLPGSLLEAVQEVSICLSIHPLYVSEITPKGKYEAALRDYKKGKFMVLKPNQLLSSVSANQDANGRQRENQLELQQRRIFDKLWNSVEKVMGLMRNELLEKLKRPGPVEQQEKILEILLDFGSANGEDPVWIFFDSQHNHITALMKATHKAQIACIEGEINMLIIHFIHIRCNPDARRNIFSGVMTSDSLKQHADIAGYLKTYLVALGTSQAENIISKAPGLKIWLAIVDLVHNISEVMLTSLPNFLRIGKSYIDGKFRKDTPSRRSPTQVQTMTADIIKTYVALLSDFFSLSDMAVTPSIADGCSIEPSFLPPGSNSLTTSFYLARILQEINDCVNELLTTDMSNDFSAILQELLDSARWKFLDVLSFTWIRDSRVFHYLETWEMNPQVPGASMYILKMQTFQKHNISSAYKIAGGSDPSTTAKPLSKKVVRPEFASKISKAFLDALYAFLDGLVHLASDDWKPPAFASTVIADAHPDTFLDNPDMDIRSTHTRLLLVLSNLNHLKETTIPQMFAQIDSYLGNTTEEERQTLTTVLSEVDRTLFEDYVKQKASIVNQTMQCGILGRNIDWFEMTRPTGTWNSVSLEMVYTLISVEVRSFIFDVLMYLVEVHAHVSNVAKPLLDRILKTLIEHLVENSLTCFKQIRRFGMGGMLRATLEIEFMHQALYQYVTPKAAGQLNEIYQKISESYSHRPGDENLQVALTEVKKTLSDTRKATGIEFLCFRVSSKKTDGHHVKKK
ncbi:hypothetical protein Clacol_004757 [Clathrus columnatus]|uniref:Exocyst complex component EXOC2/Sec5 N-terminal domain-containing protein n=1 Tax=Clathrus columnatus TaxID=1419009 RepID=A0AAV5A7C6_9AGAM|nr:hypothetical protein Clacol_004757 [Clathrus columnatus]